MDPTIQLDKARTIRYTSRALKMVEQRSGRILGELLITHASIASATYLLWGAFLHSDEAFKRYEEPSITVDHVCDLLDEHWFSKGKTLKDLSPLFAEAVVQAGMFSRGPGGKAQPETGTDSHVSGSPTGSPV